jgi:nitrous oxidase accessory protein
VLAIASSVAFTSNAAAVDLQDAINRSKAGDTIKVAAGLYRGPIVIERSVALIAVGNATIEGNGHGSVITVKADDVLMEGFRVRRSGIEIHEDAAGISISGDNVTIRKNRIEDVYFGIHAIDCGRIYIVSNDIEPGLEYTSRPGHGINVWNVKSADIRNNTIKNGRAHLRRKSSS